MKNLALLFIISGIILASSCKKDEKSERFILLTTPIWTTDSLLANGQDASGPGQVLEKFKGDAKFREDGTGIFGNYKGKWSFSPDETKVTIMSDSLILPIICKLVELTNLSLKITTAVPDKNNPTVAIDIRMTFKAK
jgi:co-chaperonin GroES (HSP10)